MDNARQMNRGLRLLGHVVTRADRRLLVHQAYEKRLRSLYGDLVLETVIPEASAFKVALGDHLDESLGVRRQEARPMLSPVPQQRDIGRSPLRNVGRVSARHLRTGRVCLPPAVRKNL